MSDCLVVGSVGSKFGYFRIICGFKRRHGVFSTILNGGDPGKLFVPQFCAGTMEGFW